MGVCESSKGISDKHLWNSKPKNFLRFLSVNHFERSRKKCLTTEKSRRPYTSWPNIKTDKHFIDLIIFYVLTLLTRKICVFLPVFKVRSCSSIIFDFFFSFLWWQIHSFILRRNEKILYFNLKSLILSYICHVRHSRFNGNFFIKMYEKSFCSNRRFVSSYK